MHTLTASEARANLYRLIDEAANRTSPLPFLASAAAPCSSLRKIGARFKKPCICLQDLQACASIKTGMAEPLSSSAQEFEW